MQSRPSKLLLVGLALGLLISTQSTAASQTYIIDTELSWLGVSSLSGPLTYTPQFAGADIIKFGGTVELDLGGGKVQFLDGSKIIAQLNSTNVAPQVGGGTAGNPGSAPGNAGVIVEGGTLGSGYAAIRNFEATLFSDPISVVADEFDPNTIQFGVVNADLDFNVTGGSLGDLIGTTVFGDFVVQNSEPVNPGSFTNIDGLDYVRVPLRAELEFAGGIGIIFYGEIAAYSAVPEPSSLALLVVAMLLTAPWLAPRLGVHAHR